MAGGSSRPTLGIICPTREVSLDRIGKWLANGISSSHDGTVTRRTVREAEVAYGDSLQQSKNIELLRSASFRRSLVIASRRIFPFKDAAWAGCSRRTHLRSISGSSAWTVYADPTAFNGS